MDILSKLPFIKTPADEPEPLTAEEIRAQNIEFHRAKVKNGPASFKSPTTGQARGMRQRRLDRQTKSARRRQVRQFFATQREAATLRGQLQAARVLPYANPEFQPPMGPQASLAAIVWVVRHFAQGDESGRVEVTHEVVIDAVQSALNRYESLIGSPASALSPEYVLPVALSA